MRERTTEYVTPSAPGSYKDVSSLFVRGRRFISLQDEEKNWGLERLSQLTHDHLVLRYGAGGQTQFFLAPNL